MRFLSSLFTSEARSDVRQPLLNSINSSLQDIRLEIVDNSIGNEISDSKFEPGQTLLSPEIESFGDSIEEEIREREELIETTQSNLKKIDRRYSLKKLLAFLAISGCSGGMGGIFYLCNEMRIMGSNGALLVNDWYDLPMNSTSNNITCAELYPSPPAGCDADHHFSPIGIDTNSSCFSSLEEICRNCLTHQNGATGLKTLPDECMDYSLFYFITGVFGALFGMGGSIYFSCRYSDLGHEYVREEIRENKQAMQKMGFHVADIVPANQFIAVASGKLNLLKVINSPLIDLVTFDALEIIATYLGDPGFNNIQRARLTNPYHNTGSFFPTINNESKARELEPNITNALNIF